jgi:hypothetical protein
VERGWERTLLRRALEEKTICIMDLILLFPPQSEQCIFHLPLDLQDIYPSYSHSVFTHFMSLLNSVTVHVKSYASYSIVNPGHIVDHIALIIAYNTVFCTLQVLNKPHLLILYPQCALWVYQALALSQIRTCLICV